MFHRPKAQGPKPKKKKNKHKKAVTTTITEAIKITTPVIPPTTDEKTTQPTTIDENDDQSLVILMQKRVASILEIEKKYASSGDKDTGLNYFDEMIRDIDSVIDILKTRRDGPPSKKTGVASFDEVEKQIQLILNHSSGITQNLILSLNKHDIMKKNRCYSISNVESFN